MRRVLMLEEAAASVLQSVSISMLAQHVPSYMCVCVAPKTHTWWGSLLPFVGVNSVSSLFSVIYHQTFAHSEPNRTPRSSSTNRTKPKQRATISTARVRGRDTLSLRLFVRFSAKIPEDTPRERSLNSRRDDFGVLNLPLRRHTWLSPSHNTVRLQETTSEEQELTFLPGRA